MKILDIALKDLMRSFRSLFAIGMMVVAPLVITGLISFAFGGMSSGSADLPEVKVGIVNNDVPPAGLPALGSTLVDMFHGPNVPTWIKASSMTDEASARTAVDGRQIGLAIIIPANFTQSAIAGGTGRANVLLVQDPTLTIGPTVVKNMIDSLLDGVSGSLTAAQVAIQHKAVVDAASTQAVIGGFQTWYTGFQTTLFNGPDSALLIQPPDPTSKSGSSSQNLMGGIMAGMMVFFAFYTGAYSMMSILNEDEIGTLARLFTTPTSRTTILAGKFVAVFLMVFVQSLVLVAAGILIFTINWGNPFTAALVIAGQVACSTGLGVLLIAFVKTARQAGPLLGGVLSALGMIGGLFTSGIKMPDAFELASKATPQGWVMAGWRLSLAGSPAADVLLPFAIMLIIGILTFAIGARIFSRRFA